MTSIIFTIILLLLTAIMLVIVMVNSTGDNGYKTGMPAVMGIIFIIITAFIFPDKEDYSQIGNKYKYDDRTRIDEAIIKYSDEFILMDSTEQIAIHKKDSSIYQYDKKQGKYIKL